MRDLDTIRRINDETRSAAEILREATITHGEWMRRKREGVVSADSGPDEEEAGFVGPERPDGESEINRGDAHASQSVRGVA